MERYSEYKDSGVKWLGEIPSHWEVKHLRNFLTLFSEKGHADSQLLSVTREKGVILRDKENKEENHNYVPDDLSGYKHLNKDDFVINKMKSWQGSYGVSDYDGIVSPAYFTCKLHGVNPKFFSRAIRSKAYVGFFMQYSKGIRVDQWDLDPNSMKDIPFVLPCEEEQEAIANYLDAATSKIDEAIAQQQKMIDLLNERKQIIINDAVTKGLDPHVKMKPSGIDWIGNIPEHWEAITLKRLFSKRIAGSWGDDEGKLSVNKICLRIADFDYTTFSFRKRDEYTIRSYSNKEVEEKSLVKGDVLIEKSGGGEKTPVGRCVLYDLDLGSPMYANFMEKLSCRSFVNSHYAIYLMSSLYSNGVVWPHIKATTGIQNLDITSLLSKESVCLPPLDEQNNIVEYLNKKAQIIINVIETCKKQISLLQERKQIIINDVVTGKVKVV